MGRSTKKEGYGYPCGQWLNEIGKPCDPATPGAKLCPGMMRIPDTKEWSKKRQALPRYRACMACKNRQRTEERTVKVMGYVPLPAEPVEVPVVVRKPDHEPMPELMPAVGEDPRDAMDREEVELRERLRERLNEEANVQAD